MKNEYTIDKGTHYSHGKKGQPAYMSLGLIVLGIILQMISGVSVWYSFACYAAGLITYWFIFQTMKNTFMRVVFDHSCLYRLDGPDRFDINKVFGIGFGDHSKYSARFGWRCNEEGDRIELMAYAHGGDGTEWKKMMSCLPNEPLDLSIKVLDDSYEFLAAKKTDGERSLARLVRKRHWLYDWFCYRLFPYFGGNLTAPHDMKMEVTQIH